MAMVPGDIETLFVIVCVERFQQDYGEPDIVYERVHETFTARYAAEEGIRLLKTYGGASYKTGNSFVEIDYEVVEFNRAN